MPETDWYKDAVIYQTHVKAFFDADDDGIGDFRGLAARLDYIAELGVTAIWLLPFYPSPLRDDGYDIADYRKIHPRYGTLRDFRHFVRACHKRGLRVITELVVNHTSDQHPWFQRARRAKPGSAARNFYVWSDTDQKYQDTRIIFLDTERSNWTWDPTAQAYFWHRFYSHQPDLNFDNPRVFREVARVLHYWMDMGVDGMRLDAVPYLVEREGTNNENLPETHDVLKRFRAEVDAHYPDRMLLAEANQWPEDVRAYFGDGDECHMAFHFPLMPRIYMAIAQEDRHPVTDIMRQTPEIPDNCQWAVFLRNHDELTLEMVTDRERDYLWQYYAADRRMRINLGIRRRLAPLMDNDRRRIELMKALLFSMPGTPILYYGDEIGMGDNIFLGDRDGVRTPMQWSPDRNGGFSRSDPAALYLPPVMNAQYGYEAVNVEAQQKSPTSLLNWTKRLIAVRRSQAAFGRGTQRFLFPRNRRVLAYLREYEGAAILCVFNVGRSAQAVELALEEFRGRIPVELFGRTAFPPVGDRPYQMTLPGYGWFWFLLAPPEEAPAWYTPMPEFTPEFVTLVVRRGLPDLAEGTARASLEREALPPWLAAQRWFAGKEGGAGRVRVRSLGLLEAAGRGTYWLASVRAAESDDARAYLIPFALTGEEEGLREDLAPFAMARARRGASLYSLVDATGLSGFSGALLDAMAQGRDMPADSGRLVFQATDRLEAADRAEASARLLGVEQTNTSLRYGEGVILKIYRRLAPGVNPELEMLRFLTRRGYANTAALLGTAEWTDAAGEPTALAAAYRYLPNQGDGWTYTLDYLGRALEEAGLAEDEVPPAERYGVYADLAAGLGRRTAELHAVLGGDREDPAFAPETTSPREAGRVAGAAVALSRRAFAALRRRRRALDAGLRPAVDRLLAGEGRVRDLLSRLERELAGIGKIRVHGDFHLGQVLIHEGDWFILDFEGEPERTLAERREKRSPLKDVAGMLRSFDYAAATAVAEMAERAGVNRETLAAAARDWEAVAARAFLDAYLGAAADVPGVPADADARARLLEYFMLEKVLYEIVYESANRPAWLGIPVNGALELLAAEEQRNA